MIQSDAIHNQDVMKKSLSIFLAALCFCTAPAHASTQNDLQKYAGENSDPDLLEALLKYGSSSSDPALNVAMLYQDYDAAYLFVEYGMDINSRGTGPYYPTPLEMAIAQNEMQVVEYLLQHEADPTTPKMSVNSQYILVIVYTTTAVYDAIMDDNVNLLMLFHAYGADLDKPCYGARTKIGQYQLTPLQIATQYQKKDIVAFLISLGITS